MVVRARSLQCGRSSQPSPVQGACETAVLSALGTEHALSIMTRGQSKANQSGQADQGAAQEGHAAEADHDMYDADTDANVDRVMESADTVEPQQSEFVSSVQNLISRQGSMRRMSVTLVLLMVTSPRYDFQGWLMVCRSDFGGA
ncbi:TPA: hypothetical protein ACH3X1_015876 [Trebouxia sp. C0004]